jgi:predicted MFS family arabinose efflux permease
MTARRLPRALAPLRHDGFRFLAAGQLSSNIGDAFYAVALPWYVLAGHDGVLLLSVVLSAYGVPRIALVAVGGQLSDRWRPWTAMMVADAVRALAVGALAGVAFAGPASAALLVPVAVILGAGEGLFLPGSFSIVPTLLPDSDLQAGNALASGGTQLAMLAGPAVGGAVVAFAGPGLAFVIDACSFVVSALTLAGIRAQRAQAMSGVAAAVGATAEPLGDASGDAAASGAVSDARRQRPATAPTLWQAFASERVLQVILLVTFAANLGIGGLYGVALPALARGPFHTGAGGYGGLVAAFGGGALAGTLLAAQTRSSSRPALIGSAAYLSEAIFMAIVPYLGGVVPASVAIAGVGLMEGFGNVLMITAFQRWAPQAHLGRLMGLLMLASLGVFPISVLVGGAVVHTWGSATFFPLAGGVIALAVLAALTQPRWRKFGVTTVGALDAAEADAFSGRLRP